MFYLKNKFTWDEWEKWFNSLSPEHMQPIQITDTLKTIQWQNSEISTQTDQSLEVPHSPNHH